MDSENDLHDAYDDDVESIDEYYSDGGNAIHYGDDDADADYDGTDDDCDDMLDDDCDNMLDDDCDNKRDQKQQNYTILKEEDIRRRQEEDTARVSTILSISKEWASILLRNFQWCVNRVHDEWFADEDRVRQTAGLLEIQSVVVPKRPAVTCGICFDHCVHETTHSTPGCGHRYCKDCWERYISISINDGPGCLFLRCPHPGCDAAIYQGMIDKLVSDEDKHKYSQYLYRSYIEGNRNTKWCPAPGCDFAVEFLADGDKKNYDVSCLCSHCFCWNCNEESHRPVDCGTVSKWLIKNSAESENMNWILVNSKSCPKCKRPIEKNHGCMHMTCSLPCKFEFCWLCLGEWSTHDKNTSTFYTCNTYEASRREGTFDVVESRKEMAKQSLERYLHYFERWQTNQSSRKKALADLDQAQTNHIPQLSDTQQTTVSQLMFITEAWLQIIECRRVLKWTYAYGYYIPDHEHAKKEFFEYAQGLAESALERLHQCAENDIRDFLRAEGPAEGFGAFRNKLSGLTSVTNTYFKNLVSALENGLSDVYRGSQTASSKQSRKGKKRSN